jgi:hypothetical protein
VLDRRIASVEQSFYLPSLRSHSIIIDVAADWHHGSWRLIIAMFLFYLCNGRKSLEERSAHDLQT